MAARDDHTVRNVAIVGAGALVLFLIFRGKGWGFGGNGGSGLSGDGGAVGTPSTTQPAPANLPPCQVKVREGGIDLDGASADQATTIARCRAAGAARVSATGAAITGQIADLVRALQAAGVNVYATTDVWNTLPATERKP